MSATALAISTQKPLISVQKRRKVILVTSNKGGTGKTTIGINLAVAAAMNGFDVGAIDLDWTQKNFDHWSRKRMRFGSLNQVPVYAGKIDDAERMLLQAERHEVVVIDTPPDPISTERNREAFASLLKAADFIVVPTQTSIFDLETTVPWCQALRRVKGDMNVAFILNRVNTRSNEIFDALGRLNREGRVCSIPIGDRTSIQRSMKSGHTIVDTTLENDKGKQDFMNIWMWLEREFSL